MNDRGKASQRIEPPAWPAQIPALTSLRFVAAMLVVLLHYRERMGMDWLAESALFTRGYLAVDFFFVLSGFVLAHVYLNRLREGRYSHISFVERRLARIWPLHVATLAVVLAIYGAMTLAGFTPNNPDRYRLELLPANLFMLHAWGFHEEQSFNYPSWSVSAEWFAYLLFPLFAGIALRLWRRPLALVALALVALVALDFATRSLGGWPLTRMTDYFGIWRIVPEFLLGVATWRLGLSLSLGRAAALVMWLAIAALVALVALGLSDLWLVPLFAVIIFTAADATRHGGMGLGPLEKRRFVYLGDVSYAVYMVHVPIYTLWFNGWVVLLGADTAARLALPIWALSLPLVVAGAMIAHHLVELPGKRWLLRLAPLTRLEAWLEKRFPGIAGGRS